MPLPKPQDGMNGVQATCQGFAAAIGCVPETSHLSSSDEE